MRMHPALCHGISKGNGMTELTGNSILRQKADDYRGITIQTAGEATYGGVVFDLENPETGLGHKCGAIQFHEYNSRGDAHRHVTCYTYDHEGTSRHALGWQFGKPIEETWIDVGAWMGFYPTYGQPNGGFVWVDPEDRNVDDPVYQIDIRKAIEAGILTPVPGLTVGVLRAAGKVPPRLGVEFPER